MLTRLTGKESFLLGTEFTGIDALNSAALRWLDTEANGTRNCTTKCIPRDLFLEESPHLQKYVFRRSYENNFRTASAKFDVTWDGCRYVLDRSLVDPKDVLRIEEENGTLLMYRTTDEKLVHHCRKAERIGQTVNTAPSVEKTSAAYMTAKRLFGDSETVCRFTDGIEQSCIRYKITHYRWIIKLTNCCSLDELEEAMEHCLAEGSCNAHELIAFLLYRHGEARLRKTIGNHLCRQSRARVKELEVALCPSQQR